MRFALAGQPRLLFVLRPLTALAVLLAGIGIGFGAMSVIAQGGEPALIHACVQRNTGAVRIVDAGAACRPNETPLHWNQQGVQGPPGEPGESSEPSFTGYEMVDAQDFVFGDDTSGTARAACPQGKIVLSGGYLLSGQSPPFVLIDTTQSHPYGSGNDGWIEYGWIASAREAPDEMDRSWNILVYALCIDAPPGFVGSTFP